MPVRVQKTKAGKRRGMATVLGEFKRGTLRSGSARGPRVRSRKQAIAIGLSQTGQSRRGGRTSRTSRRRSYRDRIESTNL